MSKLVLPADLVLTHTVVGTRKSVVWEYVVRYGKWYGKISGIAGDHKALTSWNIKHANDAYIIHLQGVGDKQLVIPFGDPAPHHEVLHDDITTETIIEPLIYREDILGPKPKYRTLQRHHVGDSRYGVLQFQESDGNWSRPELYAGVTSVCGAVLPRNKQLEKWMCGFPSYKDMQAELNKLAVRGTIMHSLFAMCLMGSLPDFESSEFDRILRRMISDNDIPVHEVFGEWKSFMCRSLLGFKQFCYDYNVEPLAIEIILCQRHVYRDDGSKPLYGYCAQLDMPCYLEIMVDGEDENDLYKSGPRKGKPREIKVKKRVLAIVDFKSGDGDYDEHDLQLLLQIPLFREAFPHLKEEIHIFNWHPKDFKMSALAKKSQKDDAEELEFGYRLLKKDHGAHQVGWSRNLLRHWQKYIANKLPIKAIYQGSPNIDTKPSENIRFTEYEEYWEEKVARAIHHKFADL